MSDKPLKQIDTTEYLTALCSVLEEGRGVTTIVTGSSMAPFLRSNKSWVYLEKPDDKLKKGDIALYTRCNNEFVLHRVYRTDGDDLYFVGDAQSVVEGPVPCNCVKGVVKKYKRRKKWKDSTTFVWNFYSRIWLKTLKLRPLMMKPYFISRRFYRKIKNKLYKQK